VLRELRDVDLNWPLDYFAQDYNHTAYNNWKHLSTGTRYELCFYLPEDGIPHSHSRENLKSYRALPAVLCSGEIMCLLWGTKWGFISKKTTFFIVTSVKTSNLTTKSYGTFRDVRGNEVGFSCWLGARHVLSAVPRFRLGWKPTGLRSQYESDDEDKSPAPTGNRGTVKVLLIHVSKGLKKYADIRAIFISVLKKAWKESCSNR
jgi:hypothetical protein